MAKVTLLGVADPDGIERLHPIREGRSAAQLRHPGVFHHRWIVGIKRGVLLTAQRLGRGGGVGVDTGADP